MRTQTMGEIVVMLSKNFKEIFGSELKIKDMGFGQFRILMLIKQYEEDGKLRQDQITKKLDINKSNVSRSIAKLLEKGYIQFQADETNKKKNNLVMTDLTCPLKTEPKQMLVTMG